MKNLINYIPTMMLKPAPAILLAAHNDLNKRTNELSNTYSDVEISMTEYKKKVKRYHRKKAILEMAIFMAVVIAMMIVGALIYNTEVPAYMS